MADLQTQLLLSPWPDETGAGGRASEGDPSGGNAASVADGEVESQLDDVSVESPEDALVREMLSGSLDLDAFAPAVEALDPPAAADALEELEADDAADVVYEMSDEQAARDLAEMQPPLAVMLLEDLAEEHGPSEPARYLTLMEPDDAVDLLQRVGEELRRAMLAEMDAETANQLRMLSAFDAESAGGMMTPQCPIVQPDWTRRRAIQQLHRFDWWRFNCVFVTDPGGQLLGSITLRDLLFLDEQMSVSDVMKRDVDVLRPHLDREEIADVFTRYDYTVMPVIDDDDRILGVVTVDDVLATIHEEHTEDAHRMVGAGKSEAVYSDLGQKFRGRFPWLVVNLFTSCVAAFVVFQFDDLIQRLTLLAVLMPVIANQAGNAGQQSLAVTLRALVLGEVRTRRVWPLVWREFVLGVLTGAIVGVSVGVILGLGHASNIIPDASWTLGLVVAAAMSGSLGVGCFVGTAMPILMDRLKRDPATASTIFLTMITDSVSFLTFLGLAWFFLRAFEGS